jgi:phosphomevalonate kinase
VNAPVNVKVRAPGKAMLVGEYAVLDGGPAVVAAIDCYAEATLDPATDKRSQMTPFLVEAEREAQAELWARGRRAQGVPIVDTSAFSRDGHKLGLGSSAAAVVAAVGALFAQAGLDPSDAASRDALHGAARRAHDTAQGVAGSGADVLAAVFGDLRTLHCPTTRGLTLPGELLLRLVPTSRSASTAELVARYRAVGAAAHVAGARQAAAARRFIDACLADDAGALLAAVAESQAAFFALSQALQRELVTDEHRAIIAAASRAGGAAKPSGAGGGDLAVVFLPREKAATFEAELTPLPFSISRQGVHVVPEDLL